MAIFYIIYPPRTRLLLDSALGSACLWAFAFVFQDINCSRPLKEIQLHIFLHKKIMVLSTYLFLQIDNTTAVNCNITVTVGDLSQNARKKRNTQSNQAMSDRKFNPRTNYTYFMLLKTNYRSGTVNSNTVNSKFHLIRSFFEIFARLISFHV